MTTFHLHFETGDEVDADEIARVMRRAADRVYLTGLASGPCTADLGEVVGSYGIDPGDLPGRLDWMQQAAQAMDEAGHPAAAESVLAAVSALTWWDRQVTSSPERT